MDTPKLLRMRELQEISGWSRGKAYGMVASGEIPSIRSGRSVRVPLDAFRRWIELNTTGGVAAGK